MLLSKSFWQYCLDFDTSPSLDKHTLCTKQIFCVSCNYPCVSISLHKGLFLLLPVILHLLSLSICLSHPCFHHCLCGSFCFGHMTSLQRFEGFRNDKTMPPSLEPSCSGAADDGPVTANHLRLVTNTHSDIGSVFFFYYSDVFIHFHFSQTMSTLSQLN